MITQQQEDVTTYESLDVELSGVFKFFNKQPALHGIDLDVRQGEFFSILGPSGCGKTTVLRLIAGFEKADSGTVFIQGRPMAKIAPHRRPVNTVFQSYALFEHLNVWDNIAFGLKLKKLRKAEISNRVKEALELVKMESLRSRYPWELSGGQQQRVALARALVNRPAVILLDEPLGALDLKLRKEMQVELLNLHQNLGLTFVMVTHDQEEALSLSQRIAVMNQGQIEQIGTPNNIYEQPLSPFVADFIGDTNLLEGEIADVDAANIKVVTKAGLTIIVKRDLHTPTGVSQDVVLSVRPEKIQLSLYKPSVQNNCFEGRLVNIMYLGTHVNYVVELTPLLRIVVMQPSTFGMLPDPETPIYAWWAEDDCLALKQ